MNFWLVGSEKFKRYPSAAGNAADHCLTFSTPSRGGLCRVGRWRWRLGTTGSSEVRLEGRGTKRVGTKARTGDKTSGGGSGVEAEEQV